MDWTAYVDDQTRGPMTDRLKSPLGESSAGAFTVLSCSASIIKTDAVWFTEIRVGKGSTRLNQEQDAPMASVQTRQIPVCVNKACCSFAEVLFPILACQSLPGKIPNENDTEPAQLSSVLFLMGLAHWIYQRKWQWPRGNSAANLQPDLRSIMPAHRLRTAFLLCLAALVGLTLVACDSSGGDGTDPSFQNAFSFNVTEAPNPSTTATAAQGKTASTLEGFSFFFDGTSPESGDETFVVYFTQENILNDGTASEGLFGFVFRESLRPGNGSYNFVSLDSDPNLQDDFGMMIIESIGDFATGDGSYSWYISENGTLEMTTSSDDRVDATISAEALKVSFDGTATDTTRVAIDGSFSARSADSFIGFSPFAP